MNEHSSIARPPKDRSWVLGYLSLFTSLSTLVCCALPSLLVLFGLGASVASMLSFMPWLVSLSHHKVWVFGVSGALILLSFVQNYTITPRLQSRTGAGAMEACALDDPACERASRFSRIILWSSAVIYAVGFFAAFLLGPLLSWIDRG